MIAANACTTCEAAAAIVSGSSAVTIGFLTIFVVFLALDAVVNLYALNRALTLGGVLNGDVTALAQKASGSAPNGLNFSRL
jgi:hypothetical protein